MVATMEEKAPGPEALEIVVELQQMREYAEVLADLRESLVGPLAVAGAATVAVESRTHPGCTRRLRRGSHSAVRRSEARS